MIQWQKCIDLSLKAFFNCEQAFLLNLSQDTVLSHFKAFAALGLECAASALLLVQVTLSQLQSPFLHEAS